MEKSACVMPEKEDRKQSRKHGTIQEDAECACVVG